jgi:hypothetical protein
MMGSGKTKDYKAYVLDTGYNYNKGKKNWVDKSQNMKGKIEKKNT